MPSGQRLKHAQHVSSLKTYFRPRLTAVASRLLKFLIASAEHERGKLVTSAASPLFPVLLFVIARASVNEAAYALVSDLVVI